MNSNNKCNYLKRYQFNTQKNNYILTIKSVFVDNEEKLELKLSLIKPDNIIHYYSVKALSEILNEYKHLNFISNIKELIDYLGELTKKNKIKIYAVSEFIFDIIYKENNNNINYKFTLVRKLDTGGKIASKKIEDELIQTHKTMENLQLQISKHDSQINILLKKYEELQKGSSEKNIDTMESRKNNNNEEEKEDKTSNINESRSYYDSFYSIDKSNNTEIFDEGEKSNSKINGKENLRQSYNIYKENNCEILFKKDPNNINNGIPIMDPNSNEECEFFTAFNIGVNNAIIVWTTKIENKTIIIENWATKKIKKIENAHRAKINILQYFHNDNIEANNNYIISLSLNDKDTLKIWEIDLISNDINLKFIQVIKEKIIYFYFFSEHLFCQDNNYLIAYKKHSNKKNIYFCKLDNDFDIIEKDKDWPLIVNTKNDVNYLDIYYQIQSNEVYLIICTNSDIEVIFRPFSEKNKEIKIFKKYSIHLSAFLTEKVDNSLKLFDSNSEGIFIWNYNNNKEPEKIFSIGATFDICLWNEENLIASSFDGFKIIDIEEEEEIKTIDKDNLRKRNGSKIRKINSPKEYESFIGINSQRKLYLYTY